MLDVEESTLVNVGFTAEIYESSRVFSESEAYRRSNRQAIALSAAFYPAIRFVVVIGFIATLFFGRVAVVKCILTISPLHTTVTQMY